MSHHPLPPWQWWSSATATTSVVVVVFFRCNSSNKGKESYPGVCTRTPKLIFLSLVRNPLIGASVAATMAVPATPATLICFISVSISLSLVGVAHSSSRKRRKGFVGGCYSRPGRRNHRLGLISLLCLVTDRTRVSTTGGSGDGWRC